MRIKERETRLNLHEHDDDDDDDLRAYLGAVGDFKGNISQLRGGISHFLSWNTPFCVVEYDILCRRIGHFMSWDTPFVSPLFHYLCLPYTQNAPINLRNVLR